MFLGSKVQVVCRADNLTAMYEPIVKTMWDPQHRPAQPVKVIDLLFFTFARH
jgi:hypothetical protein